MILILYKINEIYIKNTRTYFKNLVSLNLYKNLFRLTEKKSRYLYVGFYCICMGIKKASKRNLHIVKNVLPTNESYHILSFRSFRKFTDKLPFLICLILSYEKWEEN